MPDNQSEQNTQDPIQTFLGLYTESQNRIYGFIMSYVGDWNEADDIYQETAGVLWNKFQDYVPGTGFLSWALKIAHFQVLSHIKKQKTQKKYFSQTTLNNLNEVALSSSQEASMPVEALRECVKKLSERSKDLLELRYQKTSTVIKIAQQLKISVHTLYKQYQKIHTQLFQCVRSHLEWD